MNEARRAVLADLADRLIPSEASHTVGDESALPSAREAGVAQGGLDRVLAALPELAGPLAALLDRAAGVDPALALVELRTDPAALGVLEAVVAGAYLTEPAVLSRLGYRGRAASPVADDLDDDVVALLETAVDRGPIYRASPVPTGKAVERE